MSVRHVGAVEVHAALGVRERARDTPFAIPSTSSKAIARTKSFHQVNSAILEPSWLNAAPFGSLVSSSDVKISFS